MVCSVLMCRNRKCKSRKRDLSFHKFPLQNPVLLRVWLSNISRPGDWQPTLQSRICSDHFRSECLLKVDNRIELERDSVPTLKLNFRAKEAPKIVERLDVFDGTSIEDSPSKDHSYSTEDLEPSPAVVQPSVEVAMKEHSYFTGTAPKCNFIARSSPQDLAPDDHTYHSNLVMKQSLDDHTYNRDGEAIIIGQILSALSSTNEDLKTSCRDSDEDALRNFDHTYNHKKSISDDIDGITELSSTTTIDDEPLAKRATTLPSQRSKQSARSYRKLLTEIRHLKVKLRESEQQSSEIHARLQEAVDQAMKFRIDMKRLKHPSPIRSSALKLALCKRRTPKL